MIVSCVVDRRLESFTECASVLDDKDRYYTRSGTEAGCVCMYIVHCRVIIENRCEFQHSFSHVVCNRSSKNLRKHVCQVIVEAISDGSCVITVWF